jgi:hypothetical protein
MAAEMNACASSHRAGLLAGAALGLILATIPTVHSATTLTTTDFGAFQQAVLSDSNVVFSADGTVTFTNTVTLTNDVVISAGGNAVTLSGNGSVRLFNVNTGVSLTLFNLTLVNGSLKGTNGIAGTNGANAQGTEISGHDGKLATGGESAFGGAIYNAGNVFAASCAFLTNTVHGGSGGNGGNGGNAPLYGGNGGDGGDAGTAVGGAIYNLGMLTLTNCGFSQNVATAGDGGNGGVRGTGSFPSHDGQGGKGGYAWGGAVYNAGTALVYNCTLAFNQALGGHSQKGGASTDSNIGRSGPDGGEARGGSIQNAGTLVVVNSSVGESDADGGNAGNGGDAALRAGDGGSGGNGSGGGLCNDGTAGVTNVTFAGGAVLGGVGGSAGSGPNPGANGSNGKRRGANLANLGTLKLINTIIANPFTTTNSPSQQNAYGSVTDLGHNLSSDSTPALKGPGSKKKTDPKLGPIGLNGGLTATYPLLSNSPAIDAGDSSVGLTIDQRGSVRPSGAGIDIGAYEFGASLFNLSGRVLEGTNPVAALEIMAGEFSAETDTHGVFVFTNLTAGDYTVAPLAVGVGFTPDSISVTVSDVNVNNVNFNAQPTSLQSGGMPSDRQFNLTVMGLPGRSYIIEASTNLTSWIPVMTNQTDELGEFDFTDTTTTNFVSRFYRSRPR